jgi:hypothetical protein
MKHTTYIHIEEPCHEKWSNMSSEGKGRYCQSCSKTVMDFSTMSDTAILKYLSTASGELCGRFEDTQLHRSISTPATPAKKTFWAYLLSLCLPVMVVNRLNAQKRIQPITTKPKTEQHDGFNKTKAMSGLKNCGDTLKSETNNETGIETGLMAGDAPRMTKVVMGKLMSYDRVTVADTVSTFVTKATKNELFKIYPNPAVKGKKISIQVLKAGEYTVQLLDLDSKMIVYKTVTVTTKGQMVFLDIPSGLSSGSYYLRMINISTNKQFVDKLVVK